MTEAIRTLITVPAELRRAGFKALLQGEMFDVVGETASVREAVERIESGLEPKLLLAECPDSESEDFGLLKIIKASAPQMHIVLLVEGLSAHAVQDLCDAGIDALLQSDIAPEALVGYVNLVMFGERVIHPSIGLAALSPSADLGSAVAKQGLSNLSEREATVIQHLAAGLSNKEIARILGIMDGTVKIHVRNVQRKLKLKNRTQIAVWVVENGLQLNKAA
ncbi:MAG: LuxR C-terminal-related transcriptional regulator [Alphaproteobacteria bacterium]